MLIATMVYLAIYIPLFSGCVMMHLQCQLYVRNYLLAAMYVDHYEFLIRLFFFLSHDEFLIRLRWPDLSTKYIWLADVFFVLQVNLT